MKINLHFPTRPMGDLAGWLDGRTLGDLGAQIERAGFAGVSFPDHPLAPDAWMAAGGHQALDPFVALTTMAASTTRLRLITNLIVASYRSPFVTAKSAASLDMLFAGRLTLGMGAGYLRPEFAALGAEFSGRGATFDAAIEKLRAAWSGESFAPHDGGPTHTALPRPHQDPGPPIWIGGNSRAARRRAARLADGWIPFQQAAEQAEITGTDVLSSVAEVGAAVDEIRSERESAGRVGRFDVCWTPSRIRDGRGLLDYLDREGSALAKAGVTWITWEPRSKSVSEFVAELETVTGNLPT